MPTIDGNMSMMETEELEQIEDNNKKFLYARAVHANHMRQHQMHEILEHQQVVDKYWSMADGERDMIPLESAQYKNDLVINQYNMQMIDTDIFWYGKIFRASLMELQKIQNGETIAQSGEELSKEEIHYCDKSHTTFNDKGYTKGRKHNKIMKLRKVSVMKARHRKTGPENASRWTKTKTTNQL